MKFKGDINYKAGFIHNDFILKKTDEYLIELDDKINYKILHSEFKSITKIKSYGEKMFKIKFNLDKINLLKEYLQNQVSKIYSIYRTDSDEKLIFGYDYSLIILLNYYIQDEEIEKYFQGKIIDRINYDNFLLISFNEEQKLKKALEDLDRERPDWIRLYELNFFTIEEHTVNSGRPLQVSKAKDQLSFYNYAFSQIQLHDKNYNRLFFCDESIKIGVFDVGIENNHPDLIQTYSNDLAYDSVKGQFKNVQPNFIDNHGTMCAGLIAGTSDGKNGVEGVAKNSKIGDYRIGYKLNNDTVMVNYFNIIRCFYIASMDHQMDVINCSWGMKTPSKSIEYAIQRIFLKGRENKGTIIVAAVGNAGSTIAFPANLKQVVGVTCVKKDKHPQNSGTWKSNFGEGADVGSYGIGLITTSNVDETNDQINYAKFYGTSAAAPIVSGVIGLMLSVNPELTSTEIIEFIRNKDLLSPFPKEPREYYGQGIINVKKIINAIDNQLKNNNMSNLNYCSNLLIGGNEKQLYQNIYSSQSYQSFYSIFANIDTEKLEKNEGQELNQDQNLSGRKIKDLKFEIINYKGLLNIAFYKSRRKKDLFNKGYSIQEKDFPDDIENTTGVDKYIELILYVCAKYSNKQSSYNIEVESNDLQDIILSEGQLLYVRRVLLSFEGKDHTSLINISEDDLKQNSPPQEINGIFDDEFYFRNGKLIRKKTDTDDSLIKDNSSMGLFSIDLFDGSPSCHSSILYFRTNN